VLGWVAQRNPDLIAEISRAGHEIGSHSYWHRLIYQMSPEEFRQDLQLSRRSLEEITGQPVRLFRAPSFSITRRSLWALEILVEEGITVDSSVFPIYHDRYGIPGATPHIHCQQTPAGPLWEFPPTVVRWAGFHLPISGGGYFRLYPRQLSCRWLRKVNQRMGQPFVFYIHPWELDPQQPRLSVGSRVSRWRHYLNLASTARKLDHLLSKFRFGTVSEVMSAWMATSAPR
jgi:polysaccharide deacetylase family protein (PEP-CTERM system associated)